MKKVLIVLLVFSILTACLSSCKKNPDPYMMQGSNEYPAEQSMDAEWDRDFEITESILERLNNDTPYDELITKEIDIHAFLSKYANAHLYITLPFIGDVDEEFPIECLRKNDADYFYTIYKVKQGGLLYAFYYTSEYYIQYSWDYYYVVKPVNKSDFKTIEIGSTIEDVEEIDPATTAYKRHIIEYTESLPRSDLAYGTCMTRHYLADGSYRIYYEMKDGQFFVTNITYYPYNYDEIEDYGFERTDWHILPQDYLPAGG